MNFFFLHRPESASDAAECIRGHAVVVFLVVLFFFLVVFFLCICGHGVVVFPLRIFVCTDAVGRGGGAAACICGSRRTLVLVQRVNSVGEAVGGKVIAIEEAVDEAVDERQQRECTRTRQSTEHTCGCIHLRPHTQVA